ncbi:MAG: hypothetical protein ACFFET_15175 [Candidatus Thorarchaeota archaeon]
MKLEFVYRYFIGGVFFSLLMSGYLPLAYLVDWIVSYDPRPLTLEPLLVLFIIVYIFLGMFIVFGAINHMIVDQLWSIRATQTWQNLLGHGAVLFFFLCLIQVPVALLTTVMANTLYGGFFPSFGHALTVILGLSVLITPIPNGIICRHLVILSSDEGR